jgi:cobalamin-dependent methionine synthase I
MSPELLGSLPQLAALVEKLGVIGVLLIAVAWLVYERLRLVKQGAKTFRKLERERLIAERYRGALVAAGDGVPDISDILKIYEADKDD